MDNQHRKISGYRELSQAEIDLMNKIKSKGAELGDLVAEVNEHLKDQRTAPDVSEAEINRIAGAEPARWAAMARTDFQVGIMKLVRAVAQPTDGL